VNRQFIHLKKAIHNDYQYWDFQMRKGNNLALHFPLRLSKFEPLHTAPHNTRADGRPLRMRLTLAGWRGNKRRESDQPPLRQ
jgi:hypothetical protein